MSYNLYYNNQKLNKDVVGDDIIDHLHSRQYIFKVSVDQYGRETKERIPTKDVKVVKTYVF